LANTKVVLTTTYPNGGMTWSKNAKDGMHALKPATRQIRNNWILRLSSSKIKLTCEAFAFAGVFCAPVW